MLEDTRLKIFMAVADEGSFTRAAYLMGITQPAVSQNIAELERETGRILFERGKGAVTLTPDGERFRVHADRILREHAALDTAFPSRPFRPFPSRLHPIFFIPISRPCWTVWPPVCRCA